MFVDESGHAPAAAKAASQPVFVLGGIIIPEDVWPKIKVDLTQLKVRYGVEGEIKWRFFAHWKPGRKANSLSHLDGPSKEELKLALLDTIAKYRSVKVISVVVDTAQAYTKAHITNPDDLYHEAYKALSERFQYFLQDLERDAGVRVNGMIVCDNRNNDQDDRLKDFHQTLLSGGRFRSTYTNLIEGLFIAASHHSVGTQFADLVAGAVYRSETQNDERYSGRISSAVRRSNRGAVEGYGLVRIPRR